MVIEPMGRMDGEGLPSGAAIIAESIEELRQELAEVRLDAARLERANIQLQDERDALERRLGDAGNPIDWEPAYIDAVAVIKALVKLI